MDATDPPEALSPPLRPSGLAERDEALAEIVRRCLHDLKASSVAVYLPAETTPTLDAAVLAVSPLGVAALERVALDDDIYASAAAYRSGDVTTRRSLDIQAKHPEVAVSLAISISFPSTITAVPLHHGSRRFGTLTAFWPEPHRALPDEDKAYLLRTADLLARRLHDFEAKGVSMAPAPLPLVVSAEPPRADTDAPPFGLFAPRTAPLVYHLHKLALVLTAATHTREATARVLAHVTAAFRARAVSMCLIESDRLRLVGASGCSREYLRSLDGLPLSSRAPETDAIAQRRRLVLPGTSEAARGRLLETRRTDTGDGDCTWVVLPLMTSDRIVGVGALGLGAGSPDVTDAQAVLMALSTLLGETYERTRLYDARYELAEQLQQTLLPRMLPQPPGVLATSRYVPAVDGTDLGGDWYDLVSLADGSVAAVVGDVQGHNTTAAVVMGQLRSAVRAYATEGHDPVTVLCRTNRLLLDLETGLFARCCCVLLDAAGKTIRIAAAGGPPPSLRTAEGHPLRAAVDIGVPLGVQDHPDYRATDIPLRPGTLIALYTDGLAHTDTDLAHALDHPTAGTAYGELETLADRIIGTTLGPRSRGDDAALLLLRYEGPRHEARANVRQYAIQRRDLRGVRRVRERLRSWLAAWHLSDLADTAELLASEVVTNALVHGDSDVHLLVRRYDTFLRVEVRDSDPRPAEPVTLPRVEDQAEGGRGLLIVSALASAWGNSPSGRGKTVWFELTVSADEALARASV